jgi:four helix bundle protein
VKRQKEANVRAGAAVRYRKRVEEVLSIALKEVRESNYWLRLLAKVEIVPSRRLLAILDESNQLRAMLSKAVVTTKGKAK